MVYLFFVEVWGEQDLVLEVIDARHTILYPAFELSLPQQENFRILGSTVLPDDAIVKPPNSFMRESAFGKFWYTEMSVESRIKNN